jgi:hypothetical protein
MEVSGDYHSLVVLLPKKNPDTEQEAGWAAAELVWMIWRRRKSHASTRIQTLGGPACSIVTILSMPSRLPRFTSLMLNMWNGCGLHVAFV